MSSPAPGRGSRVSPALRWNLLGVGVVLLLVVALWPRGTAAPTAAPGPTPGAPTAAAAASGDVAAERAAADLAACPVPAADAPAAAGPLAGVSLPCLADGSLGDAPVCLDPRQFRRRLCQRQFAGPLRALGLVLFVHEGGAALLVFGKALFRLADFAFQPRQRFGCVPRRAVCVALVGIEPGALSIEIG